MATPKTIFFPGNSNYKKLRQGVPTLVYWCNWIASIKLVRDTFLVTHVHIYPQCEINRDRIVCNAHPSMFSKDKKTKEENLNPEPGTLPVSSIPTTITCIYMIRVYLYCIIQLFSRSVLKYCLSTSVYDCQFGQSIEKGSSYNKMTSKHWPHQTHIT